MLRRLHGLQRQHRILGGNTTTMEPPFSIDDEMCDHPSANACRLAIALLVAARNRLCDPECGVRVWVEGCVWR
jgi:hypothetical protein